MSADPEVLRGLADEIVAILRDELDWPAPKDPDGAVADVLGKASRRIAALRAPQDGAAASEWRPIASAPRDGTDVLLYAAAWEWTWGTQMGRFEQGQWFTTEGSVDENDADFDPAAPAGADFDPEELKNIGPTHWAPLPAPPVLAQHPDIVSQPGTGGEL